MTSVDFEQGLAFPRPSEAEVECLAGLAKLCSFRDGEPVFQAGQRGGPIYVVESGPDKRVEPDKRVGNQNRVTDAPLGSISAGDRPARACPPSGRTAHKLAGPPPGPGRRPPGRPEWPRPWGGP